LTLSEYIVENYQELVNFASRFTAYGGDVVNDLYIKSVEREYEVRDFPSYCRRAIVVMARSEKKTIELDFDIPEQANDRESLMAKEAVDEIISRLDEFDRTIFSLYLQGECMMCVSKKAGISKQTIYHSINRVKQIIKDVYER
jgi:hypothetical protein